VLDALERGAQRLGSGADTPKDFFLEAAEFIRGFADDTHHRKEEGVLFKALAQYGFSPDAGPVAVMLSEHEEARRYTQALTESAQKLHRGDQGAREDLIMYAMSYVRHLRQHIMKENNVLFPMADRVVPQDEAARIEADFARVERDEIGPGAHPKYEALARKLMDQIS
jgi:hemerythrin-like domain-containing protein